MIKSFQTVREFYDEIHTLKEKSFIVCKTYFEHKIEIFSL